MGVISAAISEQGPCRPINADAVIHDDALGFYAVADGIGSTRESARASEFAVAQAHELCREMAGARGAKPTLGDLVLEISQRFKDEFATLSRCPSTTLSIVFVENDEINYVSVGDSPLFLVADGRLSLLTKFHTIADKGRIVSDFSQLKSLTGSNFLFNSLGGTLPDPVTYPTLPWNSGSRLILCTDGFMEVLPQQELAVVSAESGSVFDMVSVTRAGASAVMPPDNYSAIIVDFIDGDGTR